MSRTKYTPEERRHQSRIRYLINLAIEDESQSLRISYRAENGQSTQRTVAPIKFNDREYSATFLALCCGRAEPRWFRVDRVIQAKLVPACDVLMSEERVSKLQPKEE